MKKRIAIDMDEVIADLVEEHLELYNSRFHEQLTREDLMGYRLWELRPERAKEILALFDEPDFFRDLKVIEGSQEVIRELQESYDIVIATAAMETPASFTAKFEWLKEHFPFLPASNFVFCGNKSVVNTDFLIDDTPKQLSHFKGQGIIYTAEHNINETRFVRVNSWEEVRELFIVDKSELLLN